MIKGQFARGNNGLVRKKYITFGIECKSLSEAKTKLSHVEVNLLNNFKKIGVVAKSLKGKDRLEVMHDAFHMGGQHKFRFDWKWLPESGLSVKDFIAPSSFTFKKNRVFEMGDIYGAMSFLSITASDISDRMLADFLDMDSNQIVSMHIHSVDQNKAIKQIKGKITELDRSKIEEQKKAVRAGYDMDIIPSDLATYGNDAKNTTEDGWAMGQWAYRMKRNYREGKLPEEKKRKLIEAGFLWNNYNSSWMKQYEKAKAFYEEYGHLSVSAKYTREHGGTLSQWLNNQRQQYNQENHGKLTEEQVELLDQIHLELRTKNEALWSKKYACMKKYAQEHGDTLVPSEYITPDGTKLGRWACRMRAEYAKGTLPTHQVELLNEIGMNWENMETVRAEQYWESMYLVAKEHHAVHGNLNISANYVTEDGTKLGQWIAQQRRLRRGTLKHSVELNSDRIGRLDALGMVWEHRTVSWDEYYEALLNYVAGYGNARVLAGYVDSNGIKLGTWVQNQRCDHRNGKLRADRIEKLNQISFVWNVEEDRWNQNYGAIRKYYEENGNSRIPQNMKNIYGESIYAWLVKVKRYYYSADAKLSTEQIKRLKELNVVENDNKHTKTHKNSQDKKRQ